MSAELSGDREGVVIQADRDCMAELLSEQFEFVSMLTAEHMRRGLYDDAAKVIATSRIASQAELVSALEAAEARFASLAYSRGSRAYMQSKAEVGAKIARTALAKIGGAS